MNYLAHFYLAGSSEPLVVGNFVADFVKGSRYKAFPEPIQRGILMHREIDHYTDQHPVVRDTKERLYSNYHKYAPVIVDMYYDHMLAAHWHEYADVSLKTYAANIYSILESAAHLLPEKALYTLTYMKMHNWLYSYASMEGIQKAMNGMSKRTRFDSKMEQSVVELKADYRQILNEFRAFLPDLATHINSFKSKD